MKKLLRILLVLLVLGAAGGIFAWYLYNKPVKQTSDVRTDFKIDAVELFTEFESDEVAANTKYLDKFLEVTGVVRDINSDEMGGNIVMEAGNDFFGINCAMEKGQETAVEKLKPGATVTVKGKCAGFSGDVVLVGVIVSGQ